MALWSIEDLKRELSSIKKIKSWVIQHESIERRERYFMTSAHVNGGAHSKAVLLDQDRDSRSEHFFVRLAIALEGKPGRQGETTKKLHPLMPLDTQLTQAMEAAAQTDLEAWEAAPKPQNEPPTLQTLDPKIGEDLDRAMELISTQIIKAASLKRACQFNSAELFVSVMHGDAHFSSGLTYRTSQSRMYTEAAFSHEKTLPNGEKHSDEYVERRWGTALDDFAVDLLFNDAAERAIHSLEVTSPTSGRYPVLVNQEVLLQIFHDCLTQLSGQCRYLDLPCRKPGEELVPGASGGDLLSIKLDPTLPLGADTGAIGIDGTLQVPIELVQENRVLRTMADQQYSSYLGVEPTASRGAVVVKAGTRSVEELRHSAPQVLEILQFSALFTDASSGTFSSEIRLARLFDNKNGKVTYLKGGSLSGSIFENLMRPLFSREEATHHEFASFMNGKEHGRTYQGPAYAVLNDVSIVGPGE